MVLVCFMGINTKKNILIEKNIAKSLVVSKKQTTFALAYEK